MRYIWQNVIAFLRFFLELIFLKPYRNVVPQEDNHFVPFSAPYSPVQSFRLSPPTDVLENSKKIKTFSLSFSFLLLFSFSPFLSLPLLSALPPFLKEEFIAGTSLLYLTQSFETLCYGLNFVLSEVHMLESVKEKIIHPLLIQIIHLLRNTKTELIQRTIKIDIGAQKMWVGRGL